MKYFFNIYYGGNMKKLILILLAIISFATFTGCQLNTNNDTKLVYESLSEKEEYLSNLTGNKILMYKLKNIPANKKYELLMTYEVYESGEKVKDEIITGLLKDEHSEKNEDKSIGINFQDGKIRYIFAEDGAYSSGNYNIEEDLTKYSQAFLVNDAKIEIGQDVYIYYAASGESIRNNIPLGTPIDSNVTNDILKDNTSTILIKLSLKEI